MDHRCSSCSSLCPHLTIIAIMISSHGLISLNLSQILSEPFTFVASCGNQFHRIILHSVKKYLHLSSLNLRPVTFNEWHLVLALCTLRGKRNFSLTTLSIPCIIVSVSVVFIAFYPCYKASCTLDLLSFSWAHCRILFISVLLSTVYGNSDTM